MTIARAIMDMGTKRIQVSAISIDLDVAAGSSYSSQVASSSSSDYC